MSSEEPGRAGCWRRRRRTGEATSSEDVPEGGSLSPSEPILPSSAPASLSLPWPSRGSPRLFSGTRLPRSVIDSCRLIFFIRSMAEPGSTARGLPEILGHGGAGPDPAGGSGGGRAGPGRAGGG